MTYEIEKCIPIPDFKRRGIVATADKLDVTESFVISKKSQRNIHSTLRRLSTKKFVVRTISETEARVWRIE